MSLVENMDGTQCGEDLMLYMEGITTISIHVLIIISIGIFRLFFLLMFRRVAVLFRTRVFLVRNPYLVLREGEVIWATFPHSGILAKLPPSDTAQFLFRVGLCCRVQ